MATTAELQEIREILNKLNIAASKAGLGDLVVGLATKQAAAVTNAKVDNTDAGAKINEIIASLKASGHMAA